MIFLGVEIKIQWVGFPKARLNKKINDIYDEKGLIMAVKFYRDLTKKGLRESKEYVEEVTDHLKKREEQMKRRNAEYALRS